MKNSTRILKLEQKLKDGRNIKIEKIDNTKVKNIKRVKIDTNQSSNKRILDFIVLLENPYVIKVNDTIVKMEFMDNNVKATDCISKLFHNLYH